MKVNVTLLLRQIQIQNNSILYTLLSFNEITNYKYSNRSDNHTEEYGFAHNAEMLYVNIELVTRLLQVLKKKFQ